jgi:serine/threonine protein kinase
MSAVHEDNAERDDVNPLSPTVWAGPSGAPSSSGVAQGPPGTATLPQDEAGTTQPWDNVDRPTGARAGDACGLPTDPGSRRVGPYRLIRRLGEGTFGIVFLAEQEGPIRRLVALKVLKGGQATRQSLGRFEIERQALAMMDHPCIAKVFDASETDTGIPYFAMELVEGEPITRFCDRRRLSIPERLRLFIPVCRAVQHAHQKRMIHRDLKPSNVLVSVGDDGPVPKVIDFGIAKAIEPGPDGPSQLTEYCQVIGTPQYMSPEQATLGGVDVDTRSDIYALGVLLYELLTGGTPIATGDLRSIPRDRLYQMIREQEAQRPSARASSGGEGPDAEAPQCRGTDRDGLVRQLRGDLDWVVMKCLEKDRARRYDTANALAFELQRHLDNEPVLAGPPSPAYRFKKFARRNRFAVAAAALGILALTLSLIASLVLLSVYRDRANEVLRLSDVNVLKELEGQHPGLFTLDHRERHAALASWVGRAREVLSRGDRHRTTLERLRRLGAPLDAGPTPVRRRFPDAPTQWQHDVLQQLVGQIDVLAAPGGQFDRAAEWLRLTPSSAEIDRRWAVARSEIAAEYPGVRLERTGALVPLGRDPASRLWEFVDLDSGLAPDRDAQGHLVIGERTGVVFVLLPGGRFSMGSPEDEPGRKSEGEDLHAVVLRPFLIAKYEITQGQMTRVAGRNAFQFIDPIRPADSVSWIAARDFCAQAGYRLPTEAQWEYACRGGSPGPYSVDAPLDELGWYKRNSGDTTHKVGRKRPNPFGLYDLHGNVLEWCQDVYSPSFYNQPEARGPDPVNDPPEPSPTPTARRVLRGGPFDGQPEYCRSADRYSEPPNSPFRNHGLRPARPIR